MFASVVLDNPVIATKQDPNASTFMWLWHRIITVGVWAGVDAFLFISGFFAAETLAQSCGDQLQSPQIKACVTVRDAFLYLFSRWMRLFPILAVVSLLAWAAGHQGCPRLDELFLVGNINVKTGSPDDTCVLIAWSLNVDFQSHASILAIILAFQSFSKAAEVLTVVVPMMAVIRAIAWRAIGSPTHGPLLAPFLVSTELEKFQLAKSMFVLPGNYSNSDPRFIEGRAATVSYFGWYSSPLFRCAVVFIGFVVWVALRERWAVIQRVRKHPWFCSLGIFAPFLFFAWGHLQLERHSEPTVMLTIFEGVGRILIGIAIGLIAILCCEAPEFTGDHTSGRHGTHPNQSAVAKMLHLMFANRLLVKLSRTTYATYLLQMSALPFFGLLWPKITKENYSLAILNITGVKAFLVTALLAVPFCVFEEVCLILRRKIVQMLSSSGKMGSKKKDWNGYLINDKKTHLRNILEIGAATLRKIGLGSFKLFPSLFPPLTGYLRKASYYEKVWIRPLVFRTNLLEAVCEREAKYMEQMVSWSILVSHVKLQLVREAWCIATL